MAEQKPTVESIQQRINAVLSSYHNRERVFAAQASAEEVEELEYHLARAEGQLRELQRRVDRLRAELDSKRVAFNGEI
ncbi:hypothetical protein [Haliea sp. E17]|uniref:hypothetical protein n=1 Tax=Haliea sp. E17 TaxID=3401576 RepID=UPI003AAE642F